MLGLLRRLHRGESGQALVMMIMAMTLVFLIGVLVVDFGFWFSGRSSVVNATDQATMSGSLKLPSDGAGAKTDAIAYLQANDPDVKVADIGVTFRCIVGDRDNNGQPDSVDITVNCPQVAPGAFTVCADGLCYANCAFTTPTSKCNTIVASGSKNVPFGFGPAFGLSGAEAAGFTSAACRGSCGAAPTVPLDIVIIIDRTDSMCPSGGCPSNHCLTGCPDIDNAKAGANAVLQIFDPSLQHVALGVIGPASNTQFCTGANAGAPGIASASGTNFVPVGLSSDYQNPDGTLNTTTSTLVKTINCLQVLRQSGLQTDLGDAMKAAADYLQNNGRTGVKKGIIFMTDGEANLPPFNSQSTGQLFCTLEGQLAGGDNDGYELPSPNRAGVCADGGAAFSDANSGNDNSTTNCSTNTHKDRHAFYGFNAGASIGAGATIDGILVRLDAWSSAGSGTRTLCVDLSWDGGATWNSSGNTQTVTLTGSQTTFLLGGPSSNWGHSWNLSQVSGNNLRVRITDVAANTTSTFNLDAVAVNVYYHQPNATYGPCNYAYGQSATARAADIEIFTIGYGIAGGSCESVSTGGQEGTGSPYENLLTTVLLADMANGNDGYTTVGQTDDGGVGDTRVPPAGCTRPTDVAKENADGDNFLCEAKGNDLKPVFTAAAEALASGSRLVKIPF